MMADRINHLLFWTSGVILPRLSSLAWRSLPASARDAALERRLGELERQVGRGELSGPDFCARAASAAGAPGMAGALIEAITAGAEVLPGMVDLLDDLAPRVRLGLLSDYPQAWLQAILAGSDLGRLFSPADIHYAAGWPGADLFDALVAAGVILPGSTVWIDYDYLRCATAMRRGIDTAICVDAPRLRRDLGLWGLVPLIALR